MNYLYTKIFNSLFGPSVLKTNTMIQLCSSPLQGLVKFVLSFFTLLANAAENPYFPAQGLVNCDKKSSKYINNKEINTNDGLGRIYQLEYNAKEENIRFGLIISPTIKYSTNI